MPEMLSSVLNGGQRWSQPQAKRDLVRGACGYGALIGRAYDDLAYLGANWNTMAKKLTPVLVYVWPTKHKGDDVWKVAIDDVGIGPLIELKTRYTRKHGAVKGAARKLNKMSIAPGRHAEVVYSKPPKR